MEEQKQHSQTSYGIEDGTEPTVAEEDRSLSATMAPDVGRPSVSAGDEQYDYTLRRDTGYMSSGYPERLNLSTPSDFTPGARSRVQPAHQVGDDTYFGSGGHLRDAKNVTFREARQNHRERHRTPSNSSADSYDEAHGDRSQAVEGRHLRGGSPRHSGGSPRHQPHHTPPVRGGWVSGAATPRPDALSHFLPGFVNGVKCRALIGW